MPMQDNRQREWMDADDADPAMLQQSLRFIERVNRWLGYTRTLLGYLDNMTAGWPAQKPLAILDVATGSADVPRAISRWADHRRLDVHVVAIDRHTATLDQARISTNDSRISLVQSDALAMPFGAGSFDFVLSSMFLHHLEADAVISVMKQADRLAREGIILADLCRSRRAMIWISLFTVTSNPMVRHDARLSVRQAYTCDELVRLSRLAGVHYLDASQHFAHRVVLAGLKPK